jgi:hypothetical protein
LRYKASKDLLETTGIKSSQMDHPIINQYYNQIDASVIPPEIMDLMQNKARSMTIDNEFEEVSAESEGDDS